MCTHHIPLVSAILFPTDVPHEKPSTKPAQSGKKITEEERTALCTRYDELYTTKTKKESIAILEKEFQRGYFSILNILKAKER
jgi:hypothetical protein